MALCLNMHKARDRTDKARMKMEDTMPQVAVFKAYPFKVGQKIRVEEAPRAGDWEVIAVNEHNVTLRCPISKKEFTWRKFCYLSEEREQAWPQKD